MNTRTVKLNVGGTIFETTKDTLLLSAFFEAKLSNWVESDKNYSEAIIFIDRSPHIFKHVLNLLRDTTYQYPVKYKEELDFFLIDHDFPKIEDTIVKCLEKNFEILNERVDEIKGFICSIKNNVIDIEGELDALRGHAVPTCEYCNDDISCRKCGTCDRHCNGHGCWVSNTYILTGSGYVKSSELRVGDRVLSPNGEESIILEVIDFIAPSKKMVNVEGIWLTHGHPIKYEENWVVPRKFFAVSMENDVSLTNFRLDKHHELTLSHSPTTERGIGNTELIVATLGRFLSNSDL